jgi:transposase-like protein
MKMTIKNDENMPDRERHRRKCSICNHAKHEEIELAYLEWETVSEICQQHGITERALYRHVKALELDQKKITNRKRFYLKVMERACLDEVSPTEAIAAGKLLEQIEGRIREGVHVQISPEQRQKEYSNIIALVRKTQTEKQLQPPKDPIEEGGKKNEETNT